MATSLKSRVIYKEHTADGAWTGAYKLLVRARNIPTPLGEPNLVDATTLEDDTQVNEMGIKQSQSMSIEGNLEKKYLDSIDALAGKKIDFINLYGTDGLGSVAKYAYTGEAVAAPSDVGGVDEILGMTVTVVAGTVPKKVTDDFDVTVTEEADGTLSFTVAAASGGA